MEGTGFSLPGTDGKPDLSDVSGPNGTLVMFICNHCPYVLSGQYYPRRAICRLWVSVAAIGANDVVAYPQDSFENMGKMAIDHSFFPIYTMNHKMWRAPMTRPAPQTFGFNRDLELQYRGRLDASGRNAGPVDLRRDLFGR